MPAVVLLPDEEDDPIPLHCVRVPCQACARPGWITRSVAAWEHIERLCEDCYWLKLQIDEPQ